MALPPKTKKFTKEAVVGPAHPRVGKPSATKPISAQSPADLIDEQLKKYRSMRDFTVTAEPAGSDAHQPAKLKPASTNKVVVKLPFVIQKHAATRLHYDFRLGWNGVLKSWAIAKGPSYSTRDKRLAVQVEDHPIEYGGFEGIIPQGQYGGGTVMLWDAGTWEPQPGHTDIDEGLRNGTLKFTMHGSKMKGNWALIRMGGKAASETKPNWLLIKEHDSFERGESDRPITEEAPKSVVTSRTLEEISSHGDHVWNSKATATGNAVHRVELPNVLPGKVRKASKSKPQKRRPADLDSYPKESLPHFIPPQLATQANSAEDRDGWFHELKLDGYRIQARKDGSRTDGVKVQLFTRTGLDWTYRMKDIAAQIAKLQVNTVILDGEVVVLEENGSTSFANLQASFRDGVKYPLTFFAFDLLHMDGHNMRGAALSERKLLLAGLVNSPDHSQETLRVSEHIETHGEQVYERACELGAEGIVSKRAVSPYTSGRSADWLKIKCVHDQEFVIGGFTLPANESYGIGALLLGYYDNAEKLIYAGRTGTGFNHRSHKSIRDQLELLRRPNSPFATVPAAAKRGAIWVTPQVMAQVNFASWTADNLVRQAAFKGLREDKQPKDVRKESGVITSVDKDSSVNQVAHSEGVNTARVHHKPSFRVKAPDQDRPKSVGKSRSIQTLEHAAIRLTHPDKIIDTDSKLTKQQLADYYWNIADHMLPQIANRPLSIVRCPEGSTQPCFYQKHVNHMLPPGIGKVDVPDKKTGKVEPYLTLSTKDALAGLAQMGALEIHPWGSQNVDLEHPDRIIIDLDPDEAISWTTLAGSAEQVRKLLKSLGLESFLKSTGGKGLHLVAPIVPEHDWAVIKQFTHAISLHLERLQPSLYLSKMSKAARKGRIYVDYLRNERGATAVAAFSPRSRAGVPVSVPLRWQELKAAAPPLFHVADFNAWKPRLSHDPWKKMPGLRQRIDVDKISKVLQL